MGVPRRIPVATAGILLLFLTAHCGKETFVFGAEDGGGKTGGGFGGDKAGSGGSKAGAAGSGGDAASNAGGMPNRGGASGMTSGGSGGRAGATGNGGFGVAGLDGNGGAPDRGPDCSAIRCEGECRRCDHDGECESGRCSCDRCVECENDDHCRNHGGDEVCDRVTGLCMRPCSPELPCDQTSPRRICGSTPGAENVCVECPAFELSCPFGRSDEAWCGFGRCVECTADSHCSDRTRPKCVEGDCRCTEDSDCLRGQRCGSRSECI